MFLLRGRYLRSEEVGGARVSSPRAMHAVPLRRSHRVRGEAQYAAKKRVQFP